MRNIFTYKWLINIILIQFCFNSIILPQNNSKELQGKVNEILSRAVVTIGGSEALKQINTMIITGHVSTPGSKMGWVMERHFQRPDKLWQGNGRSFYWMIEKDTVWAIDGDLKFSRLDGEDIAHLTRIPNIDGKFIDNQKKRIRFEYVSKDSIDEKLFHHLKMVYSDGYCIDEFFDMESGLHVMSKFETSRGLEIINFYFFKQVGDILFPHLWVNSFESDRPPHVYLIDKIQINVPLKVPQKNR